jgi:hypothetical protein
MVWHPHKGHIPRGFCGATGVLDEVQLLLVCAEPGNPHPHESHGQLSHPDGYFDSAYDYAWECFALGKDQFHKNICNILNLCWPKKSFSEQMRHTFITDAVLCSAEQEGGYVPRNISSECIRRYLLKLIDKLPNALVVALGRKAQDRLRNAGVDNFLPAFAAAPSGCNFRGASESRKRIADIVKKRTLT